MRLYFDTAYVAKCYLNEPDGKQVRRLATAAAGLYSSALCIAELSCVFQRQIREAKLSTGQADRWRSIFLDDVRQGVWVLFPVTDHLLYRVEALTRTLPSDAYLRAGDAIHLVSAKEAGFAEIWSNDQRLLSAASHFGLQGKSIT